MKTRLLLFILFSITMPVTSFAQSPEKAKALCEDSEFELVDGICQKIIQTKDIHGSYANGYAEMIIPILLLVIISIISVIYYKKLKNGMYDEN